MQQLNLKQQGLLSNFFSWLLMNCYKPVYSHLYEDSHNDHLLFVWGMDGRDHNKGRSYLFLPFSL